MKALYIPFSERMQTLPLSFSAPNVFHPYIYPMQSLINTNFWVEPRLQVTG